MNDGRDGSGLANGYGSYGGRHGYGDGWSSGQSPTDGLPPGGWHGSGKCGLWLPRDCGCGRASGQEDAAPEQND